MAIDLEQVYERLFAYCKAEDFAGYDPFDGLNSRLFQYTPIKHSRLARIAWLQMIKRVAYNLRPILRVEKGVNPKGLALFALAELARFRVTNTQIYVDNAKDLLKRLIATKIFSTTSEGKTMIAFGYNFDWQARAFYVPKGTPAIVPTAFASQAFIEAYEAFGDEQYLDAAKQICTFILTGLNRPVETADEICFSYTPVDNSAIYNASLLAGECLARVGAITNNPEYLETAAKTTRYVIRRQRDNGAWGYGENSSHTWVDSFHSAYILLSLKRISYRVSGLSAETEEARRIGTQYWLDNFFLDDGTPKYYDNNTYPIDIHSVAVAISSLCELNDAERMLPLADKITDWATANMLDLRGFFYYQQRKRGTVKTPYMRWGQAWMAYALARMIESKS